MKKLNIAGIIAESVVDGPGLRYCIFAQGCPHACIGCHNPESHSFEQKKLMSAEELYGDIKKNPLCRWVTFSGGEPFCQPDEFAQLAQLLRADGYELAAYSGYTFEELMSNPEKKQLLCLLDILVDGRYIEQQRNIGLLFKGSENQRIIDVQKSIQQNTPILTEDVRWRRD